MRHLPLLLALACAPTPPPVSPEPQDTAVEEVDEGPDPRVALAEAPFAPQPDPAHELVNVSDNVRDILEPSRLRTACEKWRDDPGDTLNELRCGKWMFFYETFDTAGVPKVLIDLLLQSFADEVGPGFERFGLFTDPTSFDLYPIGMAPSRDNTLAFTCASCHLGRLEDGRYAVGAPNHAYEYGMHNITMAVFPSAVTGGIAGEVHPDAKDIVQPLLDKVNDDLGLRIGVLATLATLAGGEIPEFPAEIQGLYAKWKSGTMDFLIAPLPTDDGVHTISKISPLWGIPTDEEVELSGMHHAMLGHTGNTPSLTVFVQGFNDLGGGEPGALTPEDVRPLVRYIESLRAPEPPRYDLEAAERGAVHFVDQGCLDCHQGPRGSGLDLYTFDEIGTDDAMSWWMDPEGDGSGCCGVDPEFVTNRIRAPRLVGLWAQKRFLHNGSVRSLDALLCLDAARPTITTHAFSDRGHTYGCDTLTEAERRDLVAFLISH